MSRSKDNKKQENMLKYKNAKEKKKEREFIKIKTDFFCFNIVFRPEDGFSIQNILLKNVPFHCW